MGRSVKFPRIRQTYSGTGVVIPSGPTAARPAAALNGTFRYNTDTSKFELYQNGNWINPTSRGTTTITKDTYTGDGVATTFGPMSYTPANANNIVVYVGNVHQNPSVSYTLSTSNIVFNAAPNAGQTIEIYHGFDSTDR